MKISFFRIIGCLIILSLYKCDRQYTSQYEKNVELINSDTIKKQDYCSESIDSFSLKGLYIGMSLNEISYPLKKSSGLPSRLHLKNSNKVFSHIHFDDTTVSLDLPLSSEESISEYEMKNIQGYNLINPKKVTVFNHVIEGMHMKFYKNKLIYLDLRMKINIVKDLAKKLNAERCLKGNYDGSFQNLLSISNSKIELQYWYDSFEEEFSLKVEDLLIKKQIEAELNDLKKSKDEKRLHDF